MNPCLWEELDRQLVTCSNGIKLITSSLDNQKKQNETMELSVQNLETLRTVGDIIGKLSKRIQAKTYTNEPLTIEDVLINAADVEWKLRHIQRLTDQLSRLRLMAQKADDFKHVAIRKDAVIVAQAKANQKTIDELKELIERQTSELSDVAENCQQWATKAANMRRRRDQVIQIARHYRHMWTNQITETIDAKMSRGALEAEIGWLRRQLKWASQRVESVEYWKAGKA